MKRRYVYLVERVNGTNYIPVMATANKRKALWSAQTYEGMKYQGLPVHIIVTRWVDGAEGQSSIVYDSDVIELVELNN